MKEKCESREIHELDWYFKKDDEDGMEDSILFCKKCGMEWKGEGYWG